ncbi:DUF2059 domain-containing protein [Luteimonas sp. SX5]|uniref:DUF2059 domain-containing protein n=1 Tax=Luteimonas galliterrae TaxID=2940486 RepID=A0ABT0MNN7_9GAMM|nr:DUF2059 domain-containing protein [Luteimonas galliterrae]MCL1635884.1 DUF2059 domain-containing protein [Luteimonas galliterrae]
MKKLSAALLAAALCLAAPFAMAAQPSDAQVDKLLEVMRARQTIDAMMPQVAASQRQMVAQMTANQKLSPEQQAKLDRLLDKSMASIARAMSWDKLEPVYRDIYRQTFTGEDMDAMIGFYGSPAGQKLLDKMPQLMQNTMAGVQKLLVPMLEEMQRDIEAEIKAAETDRAP